MKRSRAIWNYLDMLFTTGFVFLIITVVYFVAENLERYFYRYTIFPFVALILIFFLGLYLGRGIERTRKNKPIGIISRKMARERKKKNMFIFANEGVVYTPNKEIVEEIKSGEIVHVKQLNDNPFDNDEFDEIYKIQIDDLVDNEMKNKEKK